MTGIRQHIFDDELLPTVGDIEIELTYLYSDTQGRTDGPPELCYDSEVESEITLPYGWEARVIAAYTIAGQQAIKTIENRLVPDLNFDNMPKKWTEEDITK